MRNTLLALWLTLLAACTHHPVKVDCDQHLEAINPLHPQLEPAGATKSP